MKMCLNNLNTMHRTMLALLLLVLVSAVGANVNSSRDEFQLDGSSRIAWIKNLVDHHDWLYVLDANLTLPDQCASDLKKYVLSLNKGQLWASKIFDASGHYSPNILFGNEYWMGSQNACNDLQLKQYYAQTPPFDTTFFVAKINLTVDADHVPQSRLMLVGQCVPASCNSSDIEAVLKFAESAAEKSAFANGMVASFRTLYVRPVPGPYNLFADIKLQILGLVMIVVALWMLIASFYEGYLERRYRKAAELLDLEVARQNNNCKPSVGTLFYVALGNKFHKIFPKFYNTMKLSKLYTSM